MAVSPSVRINVSGARGESQADILRRSGQFGVLPTDTDEEAVGKLNADAAASAALAESAGGPTYPNVAAGEAATAEGQSFAVDNGDGTVTVYLRISGGSTAQRTLATTAYSEATYSKKSDLAAPSGSDLIGTLPHGATEGRDIGGKVNEVISLLDYVLAIDADHTNALSRAIVYLNNNPTSPAGLTGWGMGEIVLPKGRFIVSGTVAATAVFGLKIRGVSKYATTVEFHNDTDPLFSLGSYGAVTFEDLSIVHVPTNPDPDTWTCDLLRMNGAGGGNEVNFHRVYTKKFNRVYAFVGTAGNGDTFRADHCRFMDCNNFFYNRTSQGVDNLFTLCTFAGSIKKLFDIAGAGHTRLDTCNIVISGAWFSLYGMASRWGNTANFSLENVKGEFTGGSPSPTRIIQTEGDASLVLAQFMFKGCGMLGGLSVPGTTPQISVPTGVRIFWDGGALDERSIIETIGAVGVNASRKPMIVFENMLEAPLPSNVTRPAGAATAGYPPVIFRNNKNVTNITLTHNTKDIGEVIHETSLTSPGDARGRLIPAVPIDLPFYGQKVAMLRVQIYLSNISATASDKTLQIYSDAARTTLLDTITIPAATTGERIFEASGIANKITSEGLFFTYTDTTTRAGHIFCRYRSL